MGLYEVIEEVLATEGPLGETANRIADNVVECLGGVADNLEQFAEQLGEIGGETADENGEEEPDWESEPELRTIKTAADSIIGIVDSLRDAIDTAREQLEATYLKDDEVER
jgi:hypothetical protein